MNPQRGQGTCGHGTLGTVSHGTDNYLTSGRRQQSDGAVDSVKPQTGMFLRGFDMSPGFRKEV